MAATATGEEEDITGRGVEAGFLPNTNLAPLCLQKFRLYETFSNFYMIGKDKNRMSWKVLKIDRLDPSELNICEDSVTYSKAERRDLLKRIHEGNSPTGGLKFVTTCYGIVGFVKFLGPYYMLLITKRKKIGAICGQTIYAISKSKMITVQSSSIQNNVANSKNEKRYTKLLRTMGLTKDFFFSYSYDVMNSLQKNLSSETEESHYESMFVWNEFLTRRIRNDLNSTLWTVALVYGFFKQVKHSFSGKDFILTLIARRSRNYAGPRYLKRGVNEKGRVANDVETEQIMFEDVPEGQISSVVQIRGSIPLFWSQETSRFSIKPKIILSKKDTNYKATRLHFENLVQRYGNPIIILNLIKAREKKPRETILRREFVNAIESLNNSSFTDEKSLRFIHWDLNSHSKKPSDALSPLIRAAANAVNLTGIFYCHVPPTISSSEWSLKKNELGGGGDRISTQNGVLRTNCIDCIDRTNVAQYAYGLASLGQQLHALGFMESSYIDMSNPLGEDLMKLYEDMGDVLAHQYGGSAAHNKIFCEKRGQWKAATHSQKLFRILQRYYSNAYRDAHKQDAINLFLGHFRPHEDKPALWELDSDQHFNIGRHGPQSCFKRSLSAGNILSDTSMESSRQNQLFPEISEEAANILESAPDISYSRYGSTRRLFTSSLFQNDNVHKDTHACDCDCSNFLDLDMLSSSGNSFEDSSIPALSSDNLGNEFTSSAYDTGSSLKGSERTGSQVNCSDTIADFSENFSVWVSEVTKGGGGGGGGKDKTELVVAKKENK